MLILEVKLSPVRVNIISIRSSCGSASGSLDISHYDMEHLLKEHISKRHVTDRIHLDISDASGELTEVVAPVVLDSFHVNLVKKDDHPFAFVFHDISE